MNRYAAALSTHPIASQAVGEIAGTLLEQLDGERPELLVVFCSPHFAGTMEDVGAALRTLLEPGVLVGSTNAAVVGGPREVEEAPAIAAWAASLPGHTTEAVRLRAEPTPEGVSMHRRPGDPALRGDADATLLLLADPFSFPVEPVLATFRTDAPALAVIGGLASAATGPGGNRLLLDGEAFDGGAVGVHLDPSVPVDAVVSQGCRPVGSPLVVTASVGNVVQELGGRPALDRLQELAATLPEEERSLLARGLHAGLVVDEQQEEFGRGDFLVRNVLGAIRDEGAVVVGADVQVGRTFQFHVRDAAAADEDLREILAGHEAAGALLFTCTGRGRRLFGVDDHDAALVESLLGPIPLAGAFCAGELGPIRGANHVHGFTASLALFR